LRLVWGFRICSCSIDPFEGSGYGVPPMRERVFGVGLGIG